MVQLHLHNYIDGGAKSQMRRTIYRATCKDGATRLGYLCFMVKRHLFRPATEKVFLRERNTGKLHAFRPETLAIWTMLTDVNGKPICNGDYVYRSDGLAGTRGYIRYSTDIAGFVFRSESTKYPKTEPLYRDITVTNDNHEYNIHYTYTLINKTKK